MTPKEKAQNLVKRFEDGLTIKDCALIAVDEVIKSQQNIYGVNNQATKFYLQVKHEIEKL